MIIKIQNNLKLPEIAFLLFFPGFFVYHSFLGWGYLNPYMGGFFGPLAIIVLPIFILIYILKLKQRVVIFNIIDYLFLIIIILTLLLGLLGFTLNSVEDVVFVSTINQVILNLTMYLLARVFDCPSRIFQKLIIFSLIAMSAVVFFNIGVSGIFYLALDAPDPSVVASYQGFGRSIAVSAIISLAIVKRTSIFFMLSLISLCALFVNGARSELIGFCISFFFISMYKFGLKKLFLGLFLLFCNLIVLTNVVDEDIVEGNRVMELLVLS